MPGAYIVGDESWCMDQQIPAIDKLGWTKLCNNVWYDASTFHFLFESFLSTFSYWDINGDYLLKTQWSRHNVAQLPFKGKYNLSKLNLDIFTEDGIFTLLTLVIFSLILKKIETSISYPPYFTFFGKTLTVFSCKIYITFEKNWYCVCVRDIWGTQCHFMGRGSAESTDFFSGSFSQSISETIDCPILNTIKGR